MTVWAWNSLLSSYRMQIPSPPHIKYFSEDFKHSAKIYLLKCFSVPGDDHSRYQLRHHLSDYVTLLVFIVLRLPILLLCRWSGAQFTFSGSYEPISEKLYLTLAVPPYFYDFHKYWPIKLHRRSQNFIPSSTRRQNCQQAINYVKRFHNNMIFSHLLVEIDT